jgi:hypothetical protein
MSYSLKDLYKAIGLAVVCFPASAYHIEIPANSACLNPVGQELWQEFDYNYISAFSDQSGLDGLGQC